LKYKDILDGITGLTGFIFEKEAKGLVLDAQDRLGGDEKVVSGQWSER
jgi:hypothetical protein